MSLYTLISTQLNKADFSCGEEELQKLDIIEYMVLESAGLLPLLQGKPLKCIFLPGHTSNVVFKDDKKRSSLQFGLRDVVFNFGELSISKEEKTSFLQIVGTIEDKFKESTFDSEHLYYNKYQTLYTVIIPDEDIENAIKSSSLFVAAGDLSEFDVETLFMLSKKLNLYKISDEGSTLVTRLIDKVNTHLLKFDQSLTKEALPKLERKFAAMLAVKKEEHKFNLLFQTLDCKLHNLINKGTVPIPNKSKFLNKSEFDSNYSSVALSATSLRSSLFEARDNFFNNSISKESFEVFKKTCLDAIESSKNEFGKFRGSAKWYNEIHPILKSIIACIKMIGGILAAATVVPAVLTEIYSEQGYIGTFFNTKTESLRKLETFEQRLSAEDGIFNELNKEIVSR